MNTQPAATWIDCFRAAYAPDAVARLTATRSEDADVARIRAEVRDRAAKMRAKYRARFATQ